MLPDIWLAIDERRYEQAEKLLRGDEELLTSRAGQMALGYILAHTGRFDTARELFENLRQQHAGDDWEHIAVHQLGRVERLAKNETAALELFAQERQLIEQHGADAHALAASQIEAAQCHLALGQLAEARAELQRSLEYARTHDDPEILGRSERYLAEVSGREGHRDAARLHYQRALAAFQESGDGFAVREIEAILGEK